MSARGDLSKLCGNVSHDEADEMVTRFMASHFNGRMGSSGEHARITIPADPRRDDDLRMSAYVEQQREADRSTLALREVEEALRRENARLTAVLSRIAQWTHEHGKALCPTAGSADTFGDGMRAAKQQVSAHLAGAAVPAEARVFAKGDEVQCTGNRFSNPPNTVTAHGCVIAPKSHNDSVLVDFGERYGGTWLVHPRDLVLVRKATVK